MTMARLASTGHNIKTIDVRLAAEQCPWSKATNAHVKKPLKGGFLTCASLS